VIALLAGQFALSPDLFHVPFNTSIWKCCKDHVNPPWNEHRVPPVRSSAEKVGAVCQLINDGSYGDSSKQSAKRTSVLRYAYTTPPLEARAAPTRKSRPDIAKAPPNPAPAVPSLGRNLSLCV